MTKGEAPESILPENIDHFAKLCQRLEMVGELKRT